MASTALLSSFPLLPTVVGDSGQALTDSYVGGFAGIGGG